MLCCCWTWNWKILLLFGNFYGFFVWILCFEEFKWKDWWRNQHWSVYYKCLLIKECIVSFHTQNCVISAVMILINVKEFWIRAHKIYFFWFNVLRLYLCYVWTRRIEGKQKNHWWLLTLFFQELLVGKGLSLYFRSVQNRFLYFL